MWSKQATRVHTRKPVAGDSISLAGNMTDADTRQPLVRENRYGNVKDHPSVRYRTEVAWMTAHSCPDLTGIATFGAKKAEAINPPR